MKQILQPTCLILTAVILCAACNLTIFSNKLTNNSAQAAADTTSLQIVTSKYEKQSEVLSDQVFALFTGKKYDALDKLAAELRKSKKQNAAAYWHLNTVYSALESVSNSEPDSIWQKRMTDLQGWIKARPHSVLPRIALAELMVQYAWKARGCDWANTVTDKQWKIFADRLTAARRLLDEARNVPEKCPRWYMVMLTVALGQGWDLAAYNKVFEEAILKNPDYQMVYYSKTNYLLPRWFGNEGDWQNFAKQSADRLGGIAGDKLYACILREEQCPEGSTYGSDFKSGRLSWSRAKKGFQAMLAADPSADSIESAFCRMSVNAWDREQAKQLFRHLGNRVILSVWGTPDYFKQCRNWALN